MLLLAPDVRDWLAEGHFAHHVSDLVDGLDLTAFYAPYEGDGRRTAPYEPRMMVKVLVYGYATGVFSSRAMARKLEEDVAFRVLGAGNFPSHRTLCEFRRPRLEEFKGLFVEVVCLAREVGLASFGKLSIDGTKVRANASKRKAMSYGRIGVDPTSWTPDPLGRRDPPCRNRDRPPFSRSLPRQAVSQGQAPPAFRRQIVELACTGRTPEELAREWRCCCLPKGDRYWRKVRRTSEGSSEPFARRTPGLLGRSDPGDLPVHESE